MAAVHAEDFTKLFLAEARALCTPHPVHSDIALTSSIRGLFALEAKDLRAVIWQRPVPEAIAAETAEHPSATIARPLRAKWRDICFRSTIRSETSLHEDLPPALGEETRLFRNLYRALYARLYPEHANAKDPIVQTRFLGYDGLGVQTRKPHVDPALTMQTTYAGLGLELFPSIRTESAFETLCTSFNAATGHKSEPGEILPAGHVVVFKGRWDNVWTDEDALVAMPHATPWHANKDSAYRFAHSTFNS